MPPKINTVKENNSVHSSIAPSTLLPTTEIVKIAKKGGVDFGPGDPLERIRYFIKLGLLPHAVRITPDKNFSHGKQSPIGHLPYSAVNSLKKINKLFKNGFSYPAIAKKIQTENGINRSQKRTRNKKPIVGGISADDTTNFSSAKIVLMQKVGVSKKDISQKLKDHRNSIKKIIHDEVTQMVHLGKPYPDGSKTQDFSQKAGLGKPYPASNTNQNTNPKTNLGNASPNEAKLLPTTDVIKEALRAGVSFGKGDPKERIRYYIKLGILPNAKRQTTLSKNGYKENAGHLPKWTIKRIIYTDALHKKGLSYPQIAEKVKKQEEKQVANITYSPQPFAQNIPSQSKEPASASVSGFHFFNRTGLSEKEVSNRLKVHEKNIISFIDKRLSNLFPYSSPIYDAKYAYAQPTTNKITTAFKGILVLVASTGLLTLTIYSTKNYIDQASTNKQAQEQLRSESQDLLGQVLASTSDSHRLYIDADTAVSGTTVFDEDITAPNVVYSLVAGTGIVIGAGQTPSVALDDTALVTSVNDLAGSLTFAGSGATTVTADGTTITISSTDNNTGGGGDITAVSAGSGLTGGGDSGDVTLSVALTSSGTTATTSSASGLELSSGLTLLRGCGDSEVLAWVSASGTWDCSATGGGGFTSFDVSGDTGTDQTITNSNTLEIAGGTNGIDTVASATDTITINLDTTEIGSTTFGSGSAITWTFDASGGTDTTVAFGDGSISPTLSATGLFNVLTGNLKIGNGTPDVSLNGEDAYIEGTLEVDAAISADSTLTVANALTANGNTTLGNAVTDSITFTGAIQGASPLILDGATDDTNEVTIALAGDPGSDFTITIPLTNGTICITGGTCDASTLDTLDSTDFLRSNASDSYTSGTLTFDAGTTLDLDTTNLQIADTNIAFDGASTTFTTTGAFTLTPGGTVILGDGGDTTTINGSSLTFQISSTSELIISATNTTPGTAEGNSLGSASSEWEQLFLGDGNGIAFGTAQEVSTFYNTTDDVLTASTALTASQNTDYAIYTFAADNGNAGMTANQEVFEIGRGANDDSEANWVELFALDEDGDAVFAGTVTATFSGNITGNVTGNADTATALAANGGNCSTGSAPEGVDASGVVENCTDYEEDLANSAGLAAALSDETGSAGGGVAVFNNAPTIISPTITTSPTAAGATWADLGSVTTADINGGTIDGTTIGATSASTGAFTTLSASSTVTFSTFSSNGGVLYTNGSGVLAQATAGTSSQCLLGGTTPSFGSCSTGGAVWSDLTDPSADLTLAMAANNTTFTWDPTANNAETAFTLNFDGEDSTGGGDETQILLSLVQTDNGTDVDEAADALLALTNSDSNDPVQDGIRYVSGTFTTGINFDGADFTTEIVLENAEAIHNQSNGTITLEDGDGTDYATFTASLTTLASDLTVTGGDITGANGAALDLGEATSGDITITGDLIVAEDSFIGLSASTERLVFDGSADVLSVLDAGLRVYDSTDTDYIQISHDGTDVNITSANTTALNITSTQVEIGDGTDYLQISTVGDLTFVDADGAASITGPAGGALSIAAGASQALTLTGNANSTWSTSSGDIILTAADDFIFTDAQVTNIQLSDVDTSLPNSNTGIVDAINDAYNAATGSSGGVWTDSGTTVYLTNTTDELVLGGSSPLSSAKFSIDGDADQIQFLVQGNGTQTSSLAVFEQSDGTDVFTIANSGATSIIGDTVTTGNVMAISADGLSTGTALDITSTSTAGGASGTSYVLNIARSGANSNTAHTAYGISSSVSNTNATSGTNIAGYFTATGATSGNYAIYIPDQTDATGANYGLYVAGADDFALYTAADDVQFTLGAADKVYIDATTTNNDSNTAGALDIDATSNANGGSAVNVSLTSDATASVTQYGIYTTVVGSGSLGASVTSNYYGNYNYVAKSNVSDDATSTANVFGVFGHGRVSDSGGSGTQNIYGGYFEGYGHAAENIYGVVASFTGVSTTDAYGLYVNDGGLVTATNVYGIYIEDITPGSGDEYGLYIAGADDYALYAAADPVYFGGVAGSTAFTLNAGDALLNDGSLTLIDADNAASFSLTNNTASTIGAGAATGVVDIASTSLTTGTLLNLELTESTLNGGHYLKAWDTTAGASVFSVAENGVTVIQGSGSGTSALTLTTGDLTVSSGDVDISLGDLDLAAGSVTLTNGHVAITSASVTTTALSVIANSLLTNNAFGVTATGLLTGEVADFTSTHAPTSGTNEAIDINTTFSPTSAASTFSGIDLALTESSNTLANTIVGIQNTVTSQGNAAKTTYGFYSNISSNSTTADTLYGIYSRSLANSNAARTTNYGAIAYGQSASTTGDTVYGLQAYGLASGAMSSGTRNIVGAYGFAATSAGTGGTVNTYGGIFNAVPGNANGTVNAYGIYAAASGGDTNYAAFLSGDLYFTQAVAATIQVQTTTSGAGAALTVNAGNGGGTGVGGSLNLSSGTAAGLAGSGAVNISSPSGGLSAGAVNITGGNSELGGGVVNLTGGNSTSAGWNAAGVAITGGTASGSGTVGGNIALTPGTGTNRNGNILLNGAVAFNSQSTFTSSDTTPDVSSSSHWITNTTAVTITDFDAGSGTLSNGQIIFVESNGATTYDVTSSGLVGGTTDIVTASGDQTTWIYDGTDWKLVAFMDVSDNHNAGSGFDLAEWFPSNVELEAGDIVSVDKTVAQSEYIKKSENQYDIGSIGIVSTQPQIILGEPTGINPYQVALAGRVPVKVSSINGDIKAGDSLASSQIPGVAMKATQAGRSIGVALQDYSSTNPNDVGQIIVFVEPSWYIGTALANGSIEVESINGQGEPETQTVRLADLSVDGFGVLIDEGRLDGQILTAEQIRKLLAYDTEEKFEDLQTQVDVLNSQFSAFANQISSPIPDSGEEATDSAQLANESQEALDQLDNLLSSTSLEIETLIVTGDSHLASTQVAGTFSQDGTFIIDVGKQINVLGSTLFLQNDSLAGDEDGLLVNIGGGKITIDKTGNLVVEGTLTASKIETQQLTIDTSEDNSQTVGTASIYSGSNEITIATTALQPNARVLITPLGPTGGKTIYVSQKIDFEGFTVSLENGPATNQVNFDWLIVNTKQLSQAN